MLSSSSHGQAVSVAGSGSSEGVLTRRMGRETPAAPPQRRLDASASAPGNSRAAIAKPTESLALAFKSSVQFLYNI